jgi:hypothetical protein
MGNNLRVREIIQLGENENRSMHAAIEAGVTQGWHSFEQDIISHFEGGRINEDTAMLYAVNKPAMRQAIDVSKKRLGHQEESTHSFRLSEEHSTKRHSDPFASGATNGSTPSAPPPLPPLKMSPGVAARPPAPVVR